MIFINLIVVLVYIMLAVFSRKNHSKYKGNIFKGIAEFVYMKSQSRICFDGLKNGLRKIQIVSPKGLDMILKKHIVDSIALCIGVFFLFNLISVGACIVEKYFSNNANIIERDSYHGYSKEQELYLNYDGEESVYSLKVSPLQYTEEEFASISQSMFMDFEQSILGENNDLGAVCHDLILPVEDEEGIFSIKWKSDLPEVLTSRGKIISENLSGETEVALTATIEYLDYSASYTYKLTVCPYVGNVEVNQMDSIGLILDKLEKENRNEKIFEIPQSIDGVEIYLTKDAKNKGMIIFFVGIFISIMLLFLDKSKVSDAGRKRDSMLNESYPAFVNKLWLLLSTGMTIRSSLEEVVRQSEETDILIKEIEYTINQINSGMDEAQAYLDFGDRIGISNYRRLMGHISQNLRMGTKDLLKLMEDEVRTSLELKKEYTRRKGEEASTKLLFPMIILLATVMIIIIVPAIVTF